MIISLSFNYCFIKHIYIRQHEIDRSIQYTYMGVNGIINYILDDINIYIIEADDMKKNDNVYIKAHLSSIYMKVLYCDLIYGKIKLANPNFDGYSITEFEEYLSNLNEFYSENTIALRDKDEKVLRDIIDNKLCVTVSLYEDKCSTELYEKPYSVLSNAFVKINNICKKANVEFNQ